MTSCSSGFHGLGLRFGEKNLLILIMKLAKVGEEELNKNSLSKLPHVFSDESILSDTGFLCHSSAQHSPILELDAEMAKMCQPFKEAELGILQPKVTF